MPDKKEKLPLSVTHPELANEADGWDPTKVTKGSNKRMPWICRLNHRWETKVANRASANSQCPYCANKKILPGFNDIGTTHKEIAQEVFGWDPTHYSAGNGALKDWKCPLGHIYKARIADRTGKKTNCPICSSHQLLAGFNDLATAFPEIAKEALGWDPSTIFPNHRTKMKWVCSKGHFYEATPGSRTTMKSGCPFCSTNNHKVAKGQNDLATRFPLIAAEAADWDPNEVIAGGKTKKNWICPQGHKYSMSISWRTLSNGKCPFCQGKKVLKGFNDLRTTHPKLASEAVDWDATQFSAGSGFKKKWRCSLGHIYSATITSRVGLGSGCSVCSNMQVLSGFNDLETLFPEIAKEAVGWNPKSVVAGSSEKFEWRCKFGHIYKASVKNRTIRKSGCPSCSKSGFDPNQDGYLYFISHPHWKMYQIGITNDPKTRLGNHKSLGWEALELRGPMDGHLAQQWEAAILRMLKAKGADLSNSKIAGKFDGYSEAWSKSTFEVNSIKELMRLTEEFEENPGTSN